MGVSIRSAVPFRQWNPIAKKELAREEKLKVLIVGLPKSGTTALLFKLKQALPAHALCLYEPKRFEPCTTSGKQDVLAKILIGALGDVDYPSFREFDKRILIVRDPRDHFVSRLLYRACADPEFRNDDAKVSAFVETMRQKEADPRSLSLLTLLDRYNDLRDDGRPQISAPGAVYRSWAIGSYPMALTFHRQEGEFLIYKYEDLVAGFHAPLENYLDIAVPPGAAIVAEQYDHVFRTGSAGDWVNWFTAPDVEFFRPHLLPYMLEYGYADDWTLAAAPRIKSEHASKFVLRSVAHRRKSA
jgi:hypothetical protein